MIAMHLVTIVHGVRVELRPVEVIIELRITACCWLSPFRGVWIVVGRLLGEDLFEMEWRTEVIVFASLLVVQILFVNQILKLTFTA